MRPGSTMRVIAGWLCIGQLAFHPDALGAQQAFNGQIGPVSRASVQISLSVAPRLGAERAEGGASRAGEASAQPFCIWSNGAIATFSLSASDVSGPLAGKAGPYALEWRGPEGERSLVMSPGSSLTGLAAQPRENCRSGEGRRQGGLLVRRADAASGILLLLIAPD